MRCDTERGSTHICSQILAMVHIRVRVQLGMKASFYLDN